MNSQPKGTSAESWHDPRAFFLWMTLGSGLPLAAVALYSASVGTPHRYIQFLAAMSLLVSVASLGCFVVAWIPPGRRLLTWLLQRRLLVFAGLLTLVALFYAVENFRGKKAWNDYRKAWEAKGERFDLAGIIPAPVPDEANFFMSPPWEFLRFTMTNSSGGLTEAQTEALNKRQVLECSPPDGSSALPELGNRDTGRRTDLSAWQNYYRGTNNQFAAADGALTNYFPIAPTPQTPAKDLLLALSKDALTLEQLREAARRPQARFWINYDAGFRALFSHLPKVKGCVRYLTLHAIAAMADGQSEVAFNDVLLALHVTDSIKDEPILISQLVNIACAQISLVAIWEGLADHRWTDPQLAEIDGVLARLDFLKRYQLGMRGERNFCFAFVDEVRTTRDWDTYFSDPENPVAQSFLDNTFGNTAFRLVPGGWFDQNKLSLARMHLEFVLPSADVQHRTVSPTATHRLNSDLNASCLRYGPFNMFAPMLIPALSKAVQKSALAQANTDLARVAIALERHRLAQGIFPESLDALQPRFIARLPHDVINGRSLTYRRTGDGQFLLYSVGWNETDDGGSIVPVKNGSRTDIEKGDWVWRYPQP